MTELKPGTTVGLNGGGQVEIIKELGRGGQGIVYLVSLDGAQMALKWYLNDPGDKFYKNLERNINAGAPSDAFLWPEYITKRENGSFGYVMKLRPKNYYEFGNFLLAKVTFKSVKAMLAAAMKICDGFMMLHRHGYSYQDLNDGNFFIDPSTGDVLICDNDNVMPQGEKSGIMGKARYMAPEIVAGGIPDKYSDQFSLSVILFMLFYANHPFEGMRVVACPCMTESYEKRFYGSEAIFIYDPNNDTNRPVRGIHQNVIKRWMAFPQLLRDTFVDQFSEEKLRNPNTRLIEMRWKDIINKVRDEMVACPHCGYETFVEVTNVSSRCMNCGKAIDTSLRLLLGTRELPLTPKTEIFIDTDNIPDGKVVVDTGGTTLIQNVSPDPWVVETASGKVKQVDPHGYMPAKPGLKIKLKIHNVDYNLEMVKK